MFYRAANSGCSRLSVGLLALTLLSAACSRKSTNGPQPRYAVLRFENLSGDPSLDWTGRAVGESLPVFLSIAMDGPVLGSSTLNRLSPTLGIRPSAAPGISTERAKALLAGATRAVTGYVERVGGQIRITATEEDLSTGKSLRIVTATGDSPFLALDQLAHELSPRAGHGPTSNPEALRDWAVALESPPEESVKLLGQATHLDPGFGAAWVALAGLDLARGDRAAASDAIERALRQKVDPLSQADLELLDAGLKEDRTARIVAMRKVASLSPGDILMLRSLAETEVAAGEFAAAAMDWKKVTAEFPNDSAAWNSLGYARSYAGDYDGALAALRAYQRLRPKDANPPDSIGDLNYSFRKFNEAAASYLEAHRKQPSFELGGSLYKAAWAKFRAEDLAGADSLFSQFRAERIKERPSDALIELLAADWLYRTGREREAVATLRKLAAETESAPLRIDAYAQATIWDLMRGDRAQAVKDAVAIGPKITSAPVFMARFAAMPSAPASEWEMRAERMIPPTVQGLRRQALGYALILDGKREAAIPIWKQIVSTNAATDFFARAVYERLQDKPLERPLLPDPAALNQFAAIIDRL